MGRSGIMGKLLDAQQGIRCAKSNHSDFGGYDYRNAEQMLAEIKPACAELGLVVVMDDDVVEVSGRHYVRATVRLVDVEDGSSVEAHGWAREAEHRVKSDDAQITGMASSYARKYALGALFALDDGRDFDSLGDQGRDGPFVAACTACGARYRFESRDQMAASMCQCGNREFGEER